MVRGGLVKWEIVKLFLATETYNHFVSHKQKQQSGAQPACRSCTKLDQGLFDCLFLFLLSLAVFSAVVLFPPSLSFREQEKWGLPVMGHCQRRVRNLVCLVAVLQSSYPEAWFHPCLYCCSHQGQSWLSITLSQLRCNHLKFWRKPHSRVSYPLRCIFFCRKLICLSWFRHSVSYLSGKIQLQSSSSHRKWERGLEKGRPPEIARSGICLRCTVSAPCFGCPEGVLEVT